jgi:hypothetical protein
MVKTDMEFAFITHIYVLAIDLSALSRIDYGRPLKLTDKNDAARRDSAGPR